MPGSRKAPLRASLAAIAVVLAALAATFVVVDEVGELQRQRDALRLELRSTVTGWADAADRFLADDEELGSLPATETVDDTGDAGTADGQDTRITLIVLDETGAVVAGSDPVATFTTSSLPRPVRADAIESGSLDGDRSFAARRFGPNGDWTIVAVADEGAFVTAEDRPELLALRWLAITTVLAFAFVLVLYPAGRRFRSIYDRATRDVITGLANRASITATLRRRLAGPSPVVVAIVDLDDFKPVNDTWGHRIGDEALRTVGSRLERFAADHDMSVGRLGGDEFLVVATDDTRCADLAWDNLVDTMAVPFSVRDHEVRIGASVGVAHVAPDDTRTVEHVLSVADRALYRVKRDGGNGWQREDAVLDLRANREPARYRSD